MNSQEIMSLQDQSNQYVRGLLADKIYQGTGFKSWLKNHPFENKIYKSWLKEEKRKNDIVSFTEFIDQINYNEQYQREKDLPHFKKPCNEYKTAYKQYLCNGGDPADYLIKGEKNKCLKYAKMKYEADPEKFLDFLKNYEIIDPEKKQKKKKISKPLPPLPKRKPLPPLPSVGPFPKDKRPIIPFGKRKPKTIGKKQPQVKQVSETVKKALRTKAIKRFNKKFKRLPTEEELNKFIAEGGCVDCNNTCGGYLYDTMYNSPMYENEQDLQVDNYINRILDAKGGEFDMNYYDMDVYGDGMNRKAHLYIQWLHENGLRNTTRNWNIFRGLVEPEFKSKKSKKLHKGEIPSQLKKWHSHVQKVKKMKENEGKTYKEILEIAKETYN